MIVHSLLSLYGSLFQTLGLCFKYFWGAPKVAKKTWSFFGNGFKLQLFFIYKHTNV